MFLVGYVLTAVTLVKGLKHIGLDVSFAASLAWALIGGVAVALLGGAILSRIQPDPEADKDFRYSSVERIFAVLMIFTACAMAFAHGSNDVANAVGPLAAINSVIVNEGAIGEAATMPSWILLVGAMGIVFGLAILGARVMATVGTKITALTPAAASPPSWAPPPPWCWPPAPACRSPPPTPWWGRCSAWAWRAASAR